MSLKEAVRIAQSNNLMGLICTSRLLELVPALVASVKEAGLVLISDYSHDVRHSARAPPSVLGLGEGVDGLVAGNGLEAGFPFSRFYQTKPGTHDQREGGKVRNSKVIQIMKSGK
jgi:hypothetical protein